MGRICVYSKKALETMEKIMGSVKSYYPNKVYKNEQYNIYWFINSKGYMHVLRLSKVIINGELSGYAINDFMLTKDNMLYDKGMIFQADTPQKIVYRLEEMIK